MSKEEYFQSWDSENYNRLNEDLKNRIYNKYLIKCEVFQRDEFKCLNLECKTADSPLTIHHVKFQKNGGKDSARNCVTLCKSCHQAYHRGKRKIVFPTSEKLPPHISGNTFVLSTDETVDWKKVKSDMKKLRKTFVDERGIKLSNEQFAFLMRFLEMIVDLDDD